ncbi:MAG TPA: hypothetical protein VGJ93_06340 [Desulfuromonadaceae bacterium]|jgi:hypothetical protein
MSVQNIILNNSVASVTFDRSAPAINTPFKNSAPTAVLNESTAQVSSSYQALSGVLLKLNVVADSVRQADATMENIGQTVGRMKSTLEAIVKNYPPFPPGSEKRVAYLKTFMSLRNEIEHMTFPLEPSSVPKLLADPVKTGGSFSVAVDGKGTSVQLARQRVDPGPGGLNIPVLPVAPPEDAGDKAIHDAISALTTASTTLIDRRRSLSENFAQQALPAVAISVARQTGLSDAVQSGSSFSEQVATSQSQNIRDILSALPVGMSSVGDAYMKKLL